MLSRLISILLIVCCVATCVRIGQARGPEERAKFDHLSAPPLSSWSDRAINVAMVGHRSLYEDFLAIWLVQLLADRDLKSYASAEQTYHLIKSITRFHPKLESTYLFSCFVLALDFNRPDLCESISLEGLKTFPNSWRIPMTQGFVAAFKLGDHAKAAGFYAIASTRDNSPPWVQSLAKKLAAKGADEGQDLNETINLLKEVPGGTKLLELLRPRLNGEIPAPIYTPPVSQDPESVPSQNPGDSP